MYSGVVNQDLSIFSLRRSGTVRSDALHANDPSDEWLVLSERRLLHGEEKFYFPSLVVRT
jgi:hypothetical protein